MRVGGVDDDDDAVRQDDGRSRVQSGDRNAARGSGVIMTDAYRLSDEAVVLRQLDHAEARRLLADLPRMQWTRTLSSVGEWQPVHPGDPQPAIPSQSASCTRWYRIEPRVILPQD